VGPFDGSKDGRLIEWPQRPQIDDLAVDAVACEAVSRSESLLEASTIGDDADVAPGAADCRADTGGWGSSGTSPSSL
jgi:hypothetical protein